MKMLMGSHAMIAALESKGWDGPYRYPSDIDIIAPYDEIITYSKYLGGINHIRVVASYPFKEGQKQVIKYDDGTILEAEIAWEDSLQEELLVLVANDPATHHRKSDGMMIPSLDVLYMLKMSHRFLKDSPHFLKTLDDIILMRFLKAKIPEQYQDWYDRRVKATYNYGHPNLNVGKGEFFKNDEVPYTYDHDTIHEAIKVLDKPAYKFFTPNEVFCDKKMWDECSEEIKILAVLEESMVLALERSQIPYPDADPEWSFETALMKVCTSITSGWFREFAWEHYYHVMDRFYQLEEQRDHYVSVFKYGLENGIVKPFK